MSRQRALHYINPVTVRLQRTTKGPKVIERLRKKLSEQESLLLLMSPNMAFRVANRNGKVSQGSSRGNIQTCIKIECALIDERCFLGSLMQNIIVPVPPSAVDKRDITA